MNAPELHNAQLDGSPFMLEGGPIGVLLMHGFTATPVEVRLLAKVLHDHGYTVAGPLLPGHGTRPADLNRVRWHEWAAAAETSYQALQGRCAHVFCGGESMGGVLALYLASEHPEAAGVLAYAPALVLTVRPMTRLLLRLLAPIVPWRKKQGLDERHKWQGYRVDPLRGAAQLLRLQRVVRTRLAQIHQPVLVVQGRLDTTVAPEAGEIILREVGSQVKERYWMERSTHVVLLGPELDEIAERTMCFMERALATGAHSLAPEAQPG